LVIFFAGKTYEYIILYSRIKNGNKMQKYLSVSGINVKTVLYDIVMLSLITFLPAISHLIGFPLYLIEPARIILLVSIAHTEKNNVFILAVVIPIFSFMLSGHPALFKMILIISEMSLNVWLFFYFSRIFNNNFGALFNSILISKIYYYWIKYFMINTGLIKGELISTPFYMQFAVAIFLSAYVYLMTDKNSIKKA
jgi:hypothetical protein